MRKLALRFAFLLALLFIATTVRAQVGILSVTPPFAVAGSGSFTIDITGFGFNSGATVNWNGSARVTTFISVTMLSAIILQSDIAAQGAASLTVTTSLGTSPPFAFQVSNGLAPIVSWSPTYFVAGQSTTITVNGTYFISGCVVLFDFIPLTTTFVSSTQLTASVSGADVTYSGAHHILVQYPTYPANGPAATLTPSTLAYASVVVGVTSSAQTATLTNTGNATLAISSIGISGSSDFVISANSCSGTLAPNTNCTVSVTFTPSAAVGRFGNIVFNDNANNSPQTVALNGQGYLLAPVVSLLFTSHNYGSVLETGASATITEVLTNTGNANLTFSVADAISGPNAADFTIGTDTCGGSAITAGNNCSTSVTFNPSTGGAESATLTYTDNAAGSPQTVALSGTGIATAPIFSPSTTSLAFGSEPDGSTTSPMTETITNTGNLNLTFSVTPALGGTNAADFTISSHTCATGSPVTPNSTCTTSVTFTPSLAGAESATLTYTDNASGSPHVITLTGTGVALSPAVTLNPTSIAFGNIVNGNSSPATNVTLTNSGGASLTISSITLGGANPSQFSKTTTCGGTLAALANCTVAVTFSPTSIASFSATLIFTDSASGSPHNVTLTGTGTSSGSPTVSLSSSTLAFGSVTQGTTSAVKTETITNTGTANLMFSTTPAISGTNASDFAIGTETCVTGTPVAASGTCHTNVTFSPSTTSSETATLTYTDNASGSPHTVSLTGTGSAVAAHFVVLIWTASSSSNLVGYNVFRGTTNGGPYGTRLTPTPINALTYTDNMVTNATTYYYVVVAVGMNPPWVVVNSANSSQTTAVIP